MGTGEGSTGTGTGSGNTSGAGAGGSGNGKGRGSAGKGAGANPGRGAGSGTGGGSGPGTGSFAGITIQGGEGSGTNDAPAYTIAPQASYGMTVVATASSGGGLPDYGVFNDERAFTVYIPMRRTPEDEDPTWTLQYSLLKNEPSNTAGDQPVLAPSPVMREWPKVPADLEKKYAGQQQVVIYAEVDQDGKVTHISVKETPDSRVSNAIVEAVGKWVFRPAQFNGQPVAVKVLLGIPL